MFLGYPRSSHTLIGAMLDAHPNMVVAHELNVLDMVKKKNSRDWIIASILAQSDWFVNKINAQWTGYSYLIPNQWQGKYKQLKVVGDKKGGVSSRLLTPNPQLIEQLQSVLQMNIKIIHVVRNPFDIITTMASWKGEKRIENITTEMLKEQTEQFFMRVKAVQQAKNNPKYPVFDLYNEQLTAQPAQTLSQLCAFLGVDPPEDYLKDCASIVFDKILPIKYEGTVQQTETTIKQVCSFLGIEFTPEMLNPQQKVKVQLDQTDISEREKKKIGDLQKPINTNRLEAWKTRLNTTELQLIETLCADTGKLFGYQPTQNLTNNSRLKLYLSHPLRLLRMAISFRLLNKYYFYLPFEWRIWLIKKIGLKR